MFFKFHFQLNSFIVSTFNEGNDSAIFSSQLKSFFVFIIEFVFIFVFLSVSVIVAFLSDRFILLYDLSVQSCIFCWDFVLKVLEIRIGTELLWLIKESSLKNVESNNLSKDEQYVSMAKRVESDSNINDLFVDNA